MAPRDPQIATDLRICGNGDWDASQRTGSKSIMVWESTDLVHWTNQRLVKVRYHCVPGLLSSPKPGTGGEFRAHAADRPARARTEKTEPLGGTARPSSRRGTRDRGGRHALLRGSLSSCRTALLSLPVRMETAAGLRQSDLPCRLSRAKYRPAEGT